MSREIDNRVVEMEFDNSNFEKNVQTSMQTLENLNRTLEKLPESSGKGLNNLTASLNNIDLSGISGAIETINSRFSTMGIIGQEVIRNITNSAINMAKSVYNNTIGQIKSGGLSRASKLANAKFMMEGIGQSYADYADDIKHAVDGTAYGLDAAASAAAQFATAGVKAGKEMKAALRGVSGVAAMTNRSYEEIAMVFERASGQGKLTGEVLTSLSERGVNVRQVMTDFLGVTTDDLEKMVRKGEISFNTFANAMDDAFGEHAKDADRTFEGVTANIRSALSKMGALFYTPLIDNDSNVVAMLASFKTKLNEIKDFMAPAVEVITDEILRLAGVGKNWIDGWNFTPIQAFFTQLTHTFKNVINAAKTFKTKLAPIGDAVSSAFKEVFPNRLNIGTQLLNASKSLKEFTNRIKISDSGLSDFKTVITGVFSAMSLGLKIVKSLINYFKNLDVNLGGLTSKLKTVMLAISNFFIKANNEFNEADPFKVVRIGLEELEKLLNKIHIIDFLDSICDTFRFFIHYMKSTFAEVGGGFGGVVASAIMAVSFAITSLIVKFEELTGIDMGGLANKISQNFLHIRDSAVELINNLNIVEKLKSAVSAIATFLAPLKTLAGGVLNAIKNSFKQLSAMFENSSLLSPSGAINLAALVVIFEKLRKKIVDTKDEFKRIIGFFDGSELKGLKTLVKEGGLATQFENTLSTIRTSLVQFKNELKAKTIMQIAEAIAILAGSFYLLSLVDAEKMGKSALILAGLIGSMAAIFAELNNVDSDKGAFKLSAIGSQMVKLSGAVLILTAAMKQLDGLEHAGDDLLTIISLVLILVAVSEAMNLIKPQSFNKVATSMILLAASIKVLASAMAQLDGLTNIKQDLEALVGIMALVAVFVGAMEVIAPKDFTSTATGIIIVAAAIKLLASAVQSLGVMEAEQLVHGIEALTLVMGELGVAVFALRNVEGFEQTALGMLMLGAAIGIVAHAFKTIADMDPAQIGIAFVALVGSLGGLAVIISSMNSQLLEAGAGLVFIAVAMRILVGAVEELGNLEIDVLVKGFVALAAGLAAIGLACKVLEGSIAGAAAFAIAAVGLRLIAPAIEQIGSMDLGSLTKALVGLTAGLVLLASACYAMSGALAGAAAMLVVSVSMMALAAALAMFGSMDVATIATAILGLAAALLVFAGLAAVLTPVLIPMAALAATMLVISAAVAVFAGGMALLAAALEAMGVAGVIGATGLSAFLTATVPYIKKMKDMAVACVELGGGLLVLDAALLVAAVSIAAAGAAFMLLSAGLIAFSAAALLAATTMVIIKNLLIGGMNDIKEVLDAKEFENIGSNVMEALTNAIKDGISDAIAAIKQCGKDMIANLKNSVSNVKEVGKNFVQGLIDGIKSKVSNLGSEVKSLGSKALSGLKNSLKEHSPSKATYEMGEYFDDGAANAIHDRAHVVEEAAEDLGDTAIDSMANALSQIDDMDTFADPTITPVLDLSNIQNGGAAIDSMLNREQAANISANVNMNRAYQDRQAEWQNAQIREMGNQLSNVITALNSQPETPVNVNVSLEGDAEGLFRAVKSQNNSYKKMTGRSAFA